MERTIHIKNNSMSSLNRDNEESDFSRNYDEMNFRKFEMKPNKPLKCDIKENRSWVALTRNIPIDTCNRIVNIPTKETKIIHKPKIELVEKIKEVPTYFIQNKNKVIEVPEVKFVDKIQYDPLFVEKLKYVPKEITKYNIIEKPVVKNIITEKKVDVLKVQEKISFKDQEIVEEVYHYFDKDKNKFINEDGNTMENYDSLKDKDMQINFENPKHQYVDDNNILPPLLTPFGPQVKLTENKTVENVFVPKVEKVVEIKKKIDIPINLPVPYIVPKPKIIDVDVPVFKFNDKYVPVPVRKRIIPKVTWSDKVYKVDCLVEKPYLVYHNIIKIVPTNSTIKVREYPKGITKINPEELYEVDNLALWMRVNADLKKEKDKLKKCDNLSEHTCECSDCECNESFSNTELNLSQEDITTIKSSNENLFETLPLHPGHPLEMVHLQNKWIKQDTTKTQDIYDEKFMDAHRNAIFNLTTRIPREAEIEIKQISELQKNMQKEGLNIIHNELSHLPGENIHM
ncbi:inner membrane complex protein 1b, putative [Plasmodium gallinaceum]|uniref:Inner membrane complex protein 1b, putative n=1 Tax=Plasmodium gallinaceum TaxID=5849 RepID=A0A1J1GVF8_PLAGA|nr:inner membrane complex protein 1b, putative [Plasmodium gallinaceum]CRG96469.1 inner membrane complex protein 1b, putative [Plasmodium gallinaceum]